MPFSPRLAEEISKTKKAWREEIFLFAMPFMISLSEHFFQTLDIHMLLRPPDLRDRAQTEFLVIFEADAPVQPFLATIFAAPIMILIPFPN